MKIWFVAAAVAAGAAFSSPALADMTLRSQDGTMELALPNGWHEAKSEGALAKLAAMDGHGSRVVVRVYPERGFQGRQDRHEFRDRKIEAGRQ